MRVCTASYWSPAITGSGLAPVSISRGLPKAPLLYDLAGHLPKLGPTLGEWAMDEIDTEEAHRMYLARLDKLGVATVRAMLEEACGHSPGACLLCFEHDPARCHRSWFAEWYTSRTGEAVAELARPRPHSRGQLSFKL